MDIRVTAEVAATLVAAGLVMSDSAMREGNGASETDSR